MVIGKENGKVHCIQAGGINSDVKDKDGNALISECDYPDVALGFDKEVNGETLAINTQTIYNDKEPFNGYFYYLLGFARFPMHYDNKGVIRPEDDTDANAVKYTEQTLTEEQKAQARENIGAAPAVEKQYELIEDITLDEDVTSFTRSKCPINEKWNGEAYNFSAVRMYINAQPCDDATSSSQIIFNLASASNSYHIYHQQNNGLSTSARTTGLVARNDRGFVDYYAVNGSGSGSSGSLTARPDYTFVRPWDNIIRINLSTHPSSLTIPAGSRIRIYGIRG
jgi:hypothetical protein